MSRTTTADIDVIKMEGSWNKANEMISSGKKYLGKDCQVMNMLYLLFQTYMVCQYQGYFAHDRSIPLKQAISVN